MKTRQTRKAKNRPTDSAKQLPPPAEQPGQDAPEQSTMLPADPIERRRAIKDIYLRSVGANVFATGMQPFVSYAGEDTDQIARRGAETFVAALMESVQPTDVIEEMLVLQMAWTHARLARMSAVNPPSTAATVAPVSNDGMMFPKLTGGKVGLPDVG